MNLSYILTLKMSVKSDKMAIFWIIPVMLFFTSCRGFSIPVESNTVLKIDAAPLMSNTFHLTLTSNEMMDLYWATIETLPPSAFAIEGLDGWLISRSELIHMAANGRIRCLTFWTSITG